MAELRISSFENEFVLYFETPESRINAYALASTLVSLADAAKAAGRSLNSAVDIEIVVEAIQSGSFKAKIAALARESGIFTKQQLIAGFTSIVFGVLGNYIYDHTLAKKGDVQVVVNTDEVIVTQGDTKIIVPREIHDATQVVAQNPVFTRAIDQMLASITLDDRVTAFGFAKDLNAAPDLLIPRELLAIRDNFLEEQAKTRVVEENCNLYIVKAIMERSKRKWEFKWHGITISAPIKDPNFYDDFAKHNFTIAPGDEFQVRLAIHQKKDDISGIYTNTSYEILEVYRHISRPRPQALPM
ncbi:MAG: hypothetical protein JSS95_05590 [Acidobacteria bacterium]|nr:hypothetical protein [Acidobacteriota bacterium]